MIRPGSESNRVRSSKECRIEFAGAVYHVLAQAIIVSRSSRAKATGRLIRTLRQGWKLGAEDFRDRLAEKLPGVGAKERRRASDAKRTRPWRSGWSARRWNGCAGGSWIWHRRRKDIR